MPSNAVFGPTLAGLLALLIGLITARKQLTFDFRKFAGLGAAFVAAGLTTFGMEHLLSTSIVIQVIPAWMPAKPFLTYFVGIALLAAAVSLAFKRYVHLAATLLGVMFLLFVLLIQLPNVVASPRQRVPWAVMFRDLSFGGGAWALAGGRLGAIGRGAVAIGAIVFAGIYFVHPEVAPGVPLPKLTPASIPLHLLWGYPLGALLLWGGGAVLLRRGARLAATALAIGVTLSVLLIYVPPLALNRSGEAMNYAFDTLLYAGALWLLAETSPVG